MRADVVEKKYGKGRELIASASLTGKYLERKRNEKYPARIARLKTMTSAPSRMVLVLNPLPSEM